MINIFSGDYLMIVPERCKQEDTLSHKLKSAEGLDWARQFITANLPILPVPGIPEIRLHKAGPRSGLRRLAEQDLQFGSPIGHITGVGVGIGPLSS
ncbi:hypothetical protein [Rhizobium sp. RCAM05973]|uniref:hypothetical protein n=1 Tax=Rhizobium sp. RCAM05973 TaxID=2994066 RepID=UPI0032B7811A